MASQWLPGSLGAPCALRGFGGRLREDSGYWNKEGSMLPLSAFHLWRGERLFFPSLMSYQRGLSAGSHAGW